MSGEEGTIQGRWRWDRYSICSLAAALCWVAHLNKIEKIWECPGDAYLVVCFPCVAWPPWPWLLLGLDRIPR